MLAFSLRRSNGSALYVNLSWAFQTAGESVLATLHACAVSSLPSRGPGMNLLSLRSSDVSSFGSLRARSYDLSTRTR